MKEEDIEWVVNDLAELGVRIEGKCYFLYKGRSLEGSGKYYRLVGKREFGECCHPSSLERITDNYIGHHGEPLDLWKKQ